MAGEGRPRGATMDVPRRPLPTEVAAGFCRCNGWKSSYLTDLSGATLMARRGQETNAKGARLKVVRRPKRGRKGSRSDTEAALKKRIARVRQGLYELHSDLVYFMSSPAEHRDELRESLEWPDVGYITSLARALSEEERFSDWVRFNRAVKSA